MSDSPSPRIVTLERYWQAVIIRPPVSALTRLTSWFQGPVFAPRRGYVLKSYPVPLVAPDRYGSALTCWAGLEPVVEKYLRQLGYEPQVTNSVAPWLSLPGNGSLGMLHWIAMCSTACETMTERYWSMASVSSIRGISSHR